MNVNYQNPAAGATAPAVIPLPAKPVVDKNDLLSQLAEATEIKAKPGAAANPSDFEPEQQASQDFEPEPVMEQPVAPEEPVHNTPFSFYQNEAKALVKFVDGISKMYLPILYHKKLFTKQEYEAGKILLAKAWDKKSTVIPEFSEADLRLMDKMRECEALVKDIPLSDSEVELIQEPLAEVMQKYGKTTSPETRLLMACGMVFGTRLLPIMVKADY